MPTPLDLRAALTVALTLITIPAARSQPLDDDAGTAAPANTDRSYFAVGAARSLAGVAGPATVLRLTDGLDLDAILGVARLGGIDTTHLGLVVGVRHVVAVRGAAVLSLGGRVGVISPADADAVTLVLEAPARLQLAVTPWLRVHVEGGFALARTPDAMSIEGTTAGDTTWSIGSAGLTAGAGFSLAL